MIAVVLKSFAEHRPGSLVDATGWRNAENQRRARQIRAASASELALYEKGARTIHQTEAKPPKTKASAA